MYVSNVVLNSIFAPKIRRNTDANIKSTTPRCEADSIEIRSRSHLFVQACTLRDVDATNASPDRARQAGSHSTLRTRRGPLMLQSTLRKRGSGFCEKFQLNGTGSRSGRRKLTFLGNPLEGFGRTLDPVLTIIALRRKQANDFISTARSRT